MVLYAVENDYAFCGEYFSAYNKGLVCRKIISMLGTQTPGLTNLLFEFYSSRKLVIVDKENNLWCNTDGMSSGDCFERIKDIVCQLNLIMEKKLTNQEISREFRRLLSNLILFSVRKQSGFTLYGSKNLLELGVINAEDEAVQKFLPSIIKKHTETNIMSDLDIGQLVVLCLDNCVEGSGIKMQILQMYGDPSKDKNWLLKALIEIKGEAGIEFLLPMLSTLNIGINGEGVGSEKNYFMSAHEFAEENELSPQIVEKIKSAHERLSLFNLASNLVSTTFTQHNAL